MFKIVMNMLHISETTCIFTVITQYACGGTHCWNRTRMTENSAMIKGNRVNTNINKHSAKNKIKIYLGQTNDTISYHAKSVSLK